MTTGLNGNILSPHNIWAIPGIATTGIEYDIVLDNEEPGVGTYNAADDAIDSSTVP